jgi:hypothetical protein
LWPSRPICSMVGAAEERRRRAPPPPELLARRLLSRSLRDADCFKRRHSQRQLGAYQHRRDRGFRRHAQRALRRQDHRHHRQRHRRRFRRRSCLCHQGIQRRHGVR